MVKYFWMIGLSVFIALSGCSDKTVDDLRRVSVEDVEYQLLPGGARILTGGVSNISEAQLPIVQIQISLFDEYNRRVDQMMIVVRDIEVGASVRFREAVRSDFDVRGARARSVLIP